jgi:hypothetical protein
MKKVILSLFSFVLFGSVASAQFANDVKIKLMADQSIIPSGGTVDIYTQPNVLTSHTFKIDNTGAVPYSINVRKRYVTSTDGFGLKLSGTENYFCWTLCYPEATFESTPQNIAAGGNFPFVSDFKPNAVTSGFMTIEFTFFVPQTTDSVFFYITYHPTPTGIATNPSLLQNEISGAQPNPSINSTTISYSTKNAANTHLQLYNMVGVLVRDIQLENAQGKAVINTSDLENGMYFYSLVVDNKATSTKKLVITH